jgi:hypothetical protein
LSPVAILASTGDSYGSGIVTTLIFAPVALSKLEITDFGIAKDAAAHHIVRVTPFSLAVWDGQAGAFAECDAGATTVLPIIVSATNVESTAPFEVFFT